MSVRGAFRSARFCPLLRVGVKPHADPDAFGVVVDDPAIETLGVVDGVDLIAQILSNRIVGDHKGKGDEGCCCP